MNKETQSIVMTLLGALLISITGTGQYTSYVKPGFGPLLLTAGVILFLLGLKALVQAVLAERRHWVATARPDRLPSLPGAAEPDRPDAQDAHGHDHQRSRASWMMLAPVLVLLVAAPPALGADAVARGARSQAISGVQIRPEAPDASTATAAAQSRRTMAFPPMPAGSQPELTLKEFVLRALYDEHDSVATTPVTVLGFIAGAGQGRTSGYTVARVSINCCAADANPMRLYVAGDPPYPQDTWVKVVVTAIPGTGTMDNEYVPQATVLTMEPIEQPPEPYLS